MQVSPFVVHCIGCKLSFFQTPEVVRRMLRTCYSVCVTYIQRLSIGCVFLDALHYIPCHAEPSYPDGINTCFCHHEQVLDNQSTFSKQKGRRLKRPLLSFVRLTMPIWTRPIEPIDRYQLVQRFPVVGVFNPACRAPLLYPKRTFHMLQRPTEKAPY